MIHETTPLYLPSCDISLLRPSRAYCTRKLRRLYKTLKLTHGRGKYQKRSLEAGGVTEVG